MGSVSVQKYFRNKALLLLCLSSCMAAESAFAATYWVATTGNDSNTGSEAAPWRTLQRAVGGVQAGDTVRVKPGSYAGFMVGINWDGLPSGTPSAPIKFSADPGVVIVSPNSKTADGINIERADYVHVEGFTIRATVTSGVSNIGRACIRAVQNVGTVIRSNTAENCGGWGIFSGFSQNLLVEGNSTSGSVREHGIYTSNSAANAVIRSNITFNNRGCGLHFNGDASIGTDRDFSAVPNYKHGVIANPLVEGNIAYGNGLGGGAAINCDGCQDGMIRNNLAFDNRAGGITLYQQDGGEGPARMSVVNNTIIQPSTARWALLVSNNASAIRVYNNFLVHLGARGAIDVRDPVSLAAIQSDYNAVSDKFTPDDFASSWTLSQWRSNTGQDAHSFVVSPAQLAAHFVNPAGADYHLLASSPAVDAGSQQIFAPTDLEGLIRPYGAAADIGAYERASVTSPTATPVPPPTNTATATPTPTATNTPPPVQPTATPTATKTPSVVPTVAPTKTATPTPTKRRGKPRG